MSRVISASLLCTKGIKTWDDLHKVWDLDLDLKDKKLGPLAERYLDSNS